MAKDNIMDSFVGNLRGDCDGDNHCDKGGYDVTGIDLVGFQQDVVRFCKIWR